jgi:hypothetical protein
VRETMFTAIRASSSSSGGGGGTRGSSKIICICALEEYPEVVGWTSQGLDDCCEFEGGGGGGTPHSGKSFGLSMRFGSHSS